MENKIPRTGSVLNGTEVWKCHTSCLVITNKRSKVAVLKLFAGISMAIHYLGPCQIRKLFSPSPNLLNQKS